jgi:hypothetical protein
MLSAEAMMISRTTYVQTFSLRVLLIVNGNHLAGRAEGWTTGYQGRAWIFM